MYVQKDYENQLRAILGKDDWNEKFEEYLGNNKGEHSRTNIIWAMCELLKEDSNYLDAAMLMVKAYREDQSSDTAEYDEQIKNGEEVGFIYTVKATLAHLLARIIFQFNTEYYPRVLEVTEELLDDPSIYVAREAIIAIEAFAVGVYATKKADGSAFNLTGEQRKKIHDLSFKVLKTYREYPQALEYVLRAFNYLRRLPEAEARIALNYFIFKSDKKDAFQPDYVLEDAAPLLIYYAEFRTKLEDGFDSSYFKDLLKHVIKTGPSSFRTTILWNCWKAVEENESTLPILKEYFSLFFDTPFDVKDTIGQMELAVDKLIIVDINFGIELYTKFLHQLVTYAENQRGANERQIVWLIDTDQILDVVAEKSPDHYSPFLVSLFRAWCTGKVFFGDYSRVFYTYRKAPDERRGELKKAAQDTYKKIQALQTDLKDLSWE